MLTPGEENTRNTQLPELKNVGQARTFINRLSHHVVTKDYLQKRILEVSSGYQTAPVVRKDLETRSMLEPRLLGTQKKIEMRKQVSEQEPVITSENNLTRLSLPRQFRPEHRDSSASKIKSDGLLKGTPSPDTILNEWQFILNLSNGLVVTNPQTLTFKAYIEKGNNGLLVKSILKKRWWWRLVETPQDSNLVWTEWLNKDFSQKLPYIESQPKKLKTEDRQTKQLNSLKSTLKIVENMQLKQNRINKVVFLESLPKLNLKFSKEQQCYFVFGKKIHNNTQEIASQLIHQNIQKIREIEQNQGRIHNHVEGGLNFHSKKLLLSNLKKFYQSQDKNPFDNLPLTFHIKQGKNDEQFQQLLKYIDQMPGRNIWICKPGENSNRGNGITVVDTKEQLIDHVRPLESTTVKRSIIVQKYIENPYLIEKRKFDIRCYLLLTTYNGILKGYWFEEGYIRTASQQFTLQDVSNKLVHLTNDAVQKKGKDYGKFESANKMSFMEFQSYMAEKGEKGKKAKWQQSYQGMKDIARDMVQSVKSKINTKKKEFAFQLFGLDFMLDSTLKPWLIEANSNPCLDTTGPLLGRLIPDVIENVFRVAIDPIFPAPMSQSKKSKTREDYFQKNRFHLIYDSII